MPYEKTTDNTEIHYRDWGSGPAVVLIHGWPLTGDMWDKQSNFLVEQGFRVITYDRRGYGLSGHPWSGYDYDTFASDLDLVMRTCDVHEATLVGFSMGGGEVVRYLSRYGDERVSKAVLISSVVPYLLKTQDNPDGVEPSTFQDIEAQIRKDRPAFLEGFAAKFYGRSMLNHTVSDGVMQWTQAMALTATTRSTLAAAKAWSTTDFRADTSRVTIPVRLIHGTSDATVPIDISSRKALALLKHGTLSEYDGEPHGLFITAADRLNLELAEFITGAPAARPQEHDIEKMEAAGVSPAL